MIKHTQTICRLLLTNCLSVFDHFVGLALKGLMVNYSQDSRYCVGKGERYLVFGKNYHTFQPTLVVWEGDFTTIYEKLKIYSITLPAITPSPPPPPLYNKKTESKGTLEIKYLRKKLIGRKSCLRRIR